MSDAPKQTSLDSKILGFLISALALLAMTGILAFGALYMMLHPELMQPKPGPATIAAAKVDVDEDRIENGIDVATGFVAEGDYLIVKATCTACHSAKLVTQNRATRDGWLEMIRWMQETQKLWDLGPNEAKILDYLATYYAPEAKGRRAPVQVEEWYDLSDEKAQDISEYLKSLPGEVVGMPEPEVAQGR